MSKNSDFINKFFKYINTAVGRDKINRTLQYTFKLFLAYNNKYIGNEETISWLKNIYKNIQLSRKFFRIGRPLEHLNTFYKTLSFKDDISKYCILARNFVFAIYQTFDMMIWIHKCNIMKYANLKVISMNAQLFRLIGIVFGIFNQIYLINEIAKRISNYFNNDFYEDNDNHRNKNINDDDNKIKHRNKSSTDYDDKEKHGNKRYNNIYYEKDKVKNRRSTDFIMLTKKQKNHYLVLIQYSCDLLQPLSSLGYLRVDPILLSFLGIVSSLLGARAQWIKINKNI